MKTNPNDPASPCKTYEESGHVLLGEVAVFNPGLTKREILAAHAMQGILAKTNALGTNEKIAAVAVSMADALIAALNETSTSNP